MLESPRTNIHPKNKPHGNPTISTLALRKSIISSISLNCAPIAIHIPISLFRDIVNNTQSGTLRETFFANQLSQCHTLSIPAAGDFLVDETWLFEVGGRGKIFRQIKNTANSFIAYDDMEIGMGNKIPLWLFGFLY